MRVKTLYVVRTYNQREREPERAESKGEKKEINRVSSVCNDKTLKKNNTNLSYERIFIYNSLVAPCTLKYIFFLFWTFYKLNLFALRIWYDIIYQPRYIIYNIVISIYVYTVKHYIKLNHINHQQLLLQLLLSVYPSHALKNLLVLHIQVLWYLSSFQPSFYSFQPNLMYLIELKLKSHRLLHRLGDVREQLFHLHLIQILLRWTARKRRRLQRLCARFLHSTGEHMISVLQ